MLLFFGTPLLWILSLSLRDQAEILATSLNPVPSQPTLDNYSTILQSAQFPRFLFNSLLLSLGAAIGVMLVSIPAAYAFSRLDFRGRRALLLGVLGLQMISPLVVAFPLYRYFASLGLLDSMAAVGVVYVAILMPLATWMLKGFFDGIPKDLDDAARLDGASRLMVVRQDHPARRALGPHRGVRAHRDPRLGRVRHPLHPAHQPVGAADLGRHPQLPGHLRGQRDGHPGRRRHARDPPGDPRVRRPSALHRRGVPRRRAQGMTPGCAGGAPRSCTWSATPTSTRSGSGAGRPAWTRRSRRSAPPPIAATSTREFVFTRGEAWLYRWVARLDPELSERVDALVRRGQWHVTGSMVVQPDANLPTTEGWRRQLRHGRRYFVERFGLAPTVAYNVDSFGHPASLPDLLAQEGCDAYVFHRPHPDRVALPAPAFRWRGSGGAEVLGFRIVPGYVTRTEDLGEQVRAALAAMDPALGHAMCFYGVGNHGGGPTRANIEWILEHPQRRRRRAALLHPGGVLRVPRASARASCPSWRPSCSTRSRAATA